MWVQLHGLFWLTMAGIGQQVRARSRLWSGRQPAREHVPHAARCPVQVGRINATDITPTWDRIVSNFGNNAIIVYPQVWCAALSAPQRLSRVQLPCCLAAWYAPRHALLLLLPLLLLLAAAVAGQPRHRRAL